MGPFEFNAIALEFIQSATNAVLLGEYAQKETRSSRSSIQLGNQLLFSTYLGGNRNADSRQGIALRKQLSSCMSMERPHREISRTAMDEHFRQPL